MSISVKKGFTLIELLVAMAIFSILATLAYGGINSVLETRQVVAVEAKRLADVQRSFVRLTRDLGQSSPRAIRDIHGDVQPAMQTGSGTYKDAEVLIEFTVAGKRVLPGQKRSSLQRVAYAIRDNALLRLNWSVLDRAQDSEPYISVVLKNIDNLAFRYLSAEGEWQDDWPGTEASLQELPLAVEVTFDVEQWGSLRRVMLVS